jgi:hypothetical protein
VECAEAALPRTRVVVAVFENRTGDSTIDKLGVMAADYTRNALARTGCSMSSARA